MKTNKIVLLLLVATLVTLYFSFDLGRFLSLDAISAHRDDLQHRVDASPWLAAATFVLTYILVTALSLPGAAVMTLAGGALFGLALGTLLVSIASSIGATLAFLVSRLLLRDWVQQRFGAYLARINEGIRRDGAFYLFSLRLIPAVPFVVINLAMALTPLKTRQFFWVSLIGMLPGTVVYVNAGTQLGQLDSLSGILSPGLILSFVLLALFPWIAKTLLEYVEARKVYRNFHKPARFDNNLIVIGAGSAGLVTSYIAAAVKAKVTLIERHKMGGDCLNTGCVPSKALIRCARMAHEVGRAADFGIDAGKPEVHFTAVMERVQRVITAIEPHDSPERYQGLGVQCVQGQARILDPWRVKVNGQVLTARNLVIATGARPFVPPIPGLDEVGYLTSDTVWSLRQKPDRLLILGAGPIGCELAQAFQRLGVAVTLLDRADRILPREDADVAALVQQRFVLEGIDLRLGYEADSFEVDGSGRYLNAREGSQSHRIQFDQLLLALGRLANTEGFGLEQLAIACNDNGTVRVNEALQTSIPNIYACGDVAGPYQFTHAAAHQAWFAAVNSLFQGIKRFRVDYRVLPWCTFTDPEVAHVGLNEQDARAQGIAYEVTHYHLEDLDRAIAEGEAQGFVKVLTVPGKDKILGATIVGHQAGELITEYVTAMKQDLGLNKILGTIHVYPTLSEANKYAAGEWKRAHAPQPVLRWLERWHRWRRG